jgi:hypothetical protein
MALSGRLPAIRTESGMRLFRREDVERLATTRARQISACDAHRETGSDESGMESTNENA